MSPVLEVADIFRRYGEAFRQARAGHLGRVERRVMGAITACRTAVLGSQVEQCDDCGATRIAYNSCAKALPEVPGLGARAMACRATSRTPSRVILPRPLHLAGAGQRDCFPEQGGRLCHSVPLRGRDAHHHRGRLQASRRSARCDRRPPYLGSDPTTPSAYPLRRAWWWTLTRRHTLGRLPARLLPAGARPLQAVPPSVSARAPSWSSSISPIPPHSPSASLNFDGPTGWSMPSRHSAGPNRCWLISAAIRIASPSPTVG